MEDMFERSRLLMGSGSLCRLRGLRAAVFGLGGVGGYAAEALARSGVGAIDLIDGDIVNLSNFNRQIVATRSGLGRPKAELMKERISDIDPDIRVRAYTEYLRAGSAESFPFDEPDVIIDAVDEVGAKILLSSIAREKGICMVSSMGAGGRLDISAVRAADIYETHMCPLAKIVRKELKACGIRKLRVVFSEEPPAKIRGEDGSPGSMIFVPAVFGLLLAAEVVGAFADGDPERLRVC